MDVITVAQLENHISKRRFPPVSRRPASDMSGFYPSDTVSAAGAVPFNASNAVPRFSVFSCIREYPAALSFPVLFLITALVLVSLGPLAEQRVGMYRTGILSVHRDSALESSMRRLIVPEVRAEQLSVETIASIPESIREVSYSEYRVRNGDTISGIQNRFGLQNLSSILAVNNIANARRIRPGQVLRIPSIDGITHTVVRGDSLEALAGRYGTDVTAILDSNDLVDAALVPGQLLFIPGASMSTLALRRAMGELFITPVRGRISSPFGYRNDPFTGVRTFHTGIDIAAPVGTSIKVTLDGRVATTGYSPVYGNYVIVSHDGGYQSLYAHMSRILVARGQWVVQGGVLGAVGNTGYSTGSHLHFSVYRNGKMVNPASILH